MPSSLVVMVPSPSLSMRKNAFLNSGNRHRGDGVTCCHQEGPGTAGGSMGGTSCTARSPRWPASPPVCPGATPLTHQWPLLGVALSPRQPNVPSWVSHCQPRHLNISSRVSHCHPSTPMSPPWCPAVTLTHQCNPSTLVCPPNPVTPHGPTPLPPSVPPLPSAPPSVFPARVPSGVPSPRCHPLCSPHLQSAPQ